VSVFIEPFILGRCRVLFAPVKELTFIGGVWLSFVAPFKALNSKPCRQGDQGPMLWLFKYFRRKIQQKMSFLTQNKANFKKLIITLVFEKNANFFAQNCQKSQKIVIITSVPDSAKIRSMGDSLLWQLRCVKNTDVCSQHFGGYFKQQSRQHVLDYILWSVYTNGDFQCRMRLSHPTPHKK
jgi:hypothetical protein